MEGVQLVSYSLEGEFNSMDVNRSGMGAFGAVLERDLRAATRQPATWWRRLPFPVICTCLIAGLWIAASYHGTTGPSLSFAAAKAIGFPLLLYCLFRGVRLTADSLSAERRQGTLPLLFLTDLTPSGIVLSKAASAFVKAFSPLLALIPALAALLLLGGVTGHTLRRVALALTSTLALSLSVGMAISSVSRDQKKSENTASFMVLFLWLGMLFLDQWIRRQVPAWPEVFSVRQLSPAWLHELAFGPPMGVRSEAFWRAVGIVWLETALLLGFAIWRLKRSWRGESAPSPGDSIPSSQKAINPRVRSRIAGANSRNELLNANPFCWLIAREPWRQARIWGILAFCVGCCGLIAWVVQRGGDEQFIPFFALLTLVAWYVMLKVLLAEESGRELAAQRSTGALEFLLVTPLGPKQILEGQWLGIRKRFAGPVLAFFALLLVVLASTVSGSWPWVGPMETADGVSFLLAGAVMFAADAITLGWVGMWLSLKLRKRRDVAGSTVWRVLVVPNLLFLGWMVFLGMTFLRSGSSVGPRLQLAVWLAIGLLTDLLLVRWCRHRLAMNFRELATLEYVHSVPSGAWGRRLGALAGRWSRRWFGPARPLASV